MMCQVKFCNMASLYFEFTLYTSDLHGPPCSDTSGVTVVHLHRPPATVVHDAYNVLAQSVIEGLHELYMAARMLYINFCMPSYTYYCLQLLHL